MKLRCCSHEMPAGRRPARSSLTRARDFIHSHLGERRSLDEMAAVACMSKFHFVREFTRVFGTPPLAYRNAQRINEACRLLAAGRPIKVIAADLGFTDQSHFGRVFRRSVGLTPAAYQRAMGEGSELLPRGGVDVSAQGRAATTRAGRQHDFNRFSVDAVFSANR
jgi:AraC-like DNA-binding protein